MVEEDERMKEQLRRQIKMKKKGAKGSANKNKEIAPATQNFVDDESRNE